MPVPQTLSRGGGEVEANLSAQINQWKTVNLNQTVSQAQQAISHYHFEADPLQALVDNPKADYIWFDLGINPQNEITFHATAVANDGNTIAKAPSSIIYKRDFPTDFSSLQTSSVTYSEKSLAKPITGQHLLPFQDAYTYLDKVEGSFSTNFEVTFTYGDIRVERFGLEIATVQEMLNEENVSAIALFFGVNPEAKATTVFMGKDKNDVLLLGDQNATRDFSQRCPPKCN